MGQTAKLGLPYPEDPDSPNVPRDIKALANKLESVIGPAGSKDHPFIVISGLYSSDWQVFRATPGTTSSFTPFPDPTYTGSSTNNVKTPTRWQFTAPEDGVLNLTGSFTLGYLGAHSTPTMALDFIMNYNHVSGPNWPLNTGQGVHYSRIVRHRNSEGHSSDGLDLTYRFERSAAILKGTTCAPMFFWRGTTAVANAPRFKWARINGLFTPGQVKGENAWEPGGYSQPYGATPPAVVADPLDAGFQIAQNE